MSDGGPGKDGKEVMQKNHVARQVVDRSLIPDPGPPACIAQAHPAYLYLAIRFYNHIDAPTGPHGLGLYCSGRNDPDGFVQRLGSPTTDHAEWQGLMNGTLVPIQVQYTIARTTILGLIGKGEQASQGFLSDVIVSGQFDAQRAYR
ncbi:hypothetical protein PMIN02_011438 [Paraphaeosphaeria minitans]|uniref:Uncharacterized protein n=1 Tax=Paraphaeosphaeria minitans TaxID=565426 RepID=A0A9P6KTC2_9PLEO|nr:hypothetical protein PMIN01_03398 [Paraphaeosphaeria minitans]